MSKAAVRGAKSIAKCIAPPTSCFHLEILFFFSFPHVFHKLGRFDMITAASVSRAVLLSNSARSETKERIVRADSEGKCVAAGGSGIGCGLPVDRNARARRLQERVVTRVCR